MELDEAIALTIDILIAGRARQYGYDLYPPQVARAFVERQRNIRDANREVVVRQITPICMDAAWELCRRGLVRPGVKNARERGVDRFLTPSTTRRANSPSMRSIATSSLPYQFATALTMPRMPSTAKRVSRSERNSPRRTPSLRTSSNTLSRPRDHIRPRPAGKRARARPPWRKNSNRGSPA
jgi:hypothetical protein